jgi:hypothetical protein
MRPDSFTMSRVCQALLPMLIAAGMAGCGGWRFRAIDRHAQR